jgi:hypothetical protein
LLDRVAKVVHYRNRAEQIRKIAAGIPDDEERCMLLEIAHEYEQLGWNTQQDRASGVSEAGQN